MTGETLSQPTFGIFGDTLNTFLGIGGVVAVIAIYFIVTYNNIIRSKNNVDEAFSSIDTVLQNRYNLIPNLIEIVKQYMTHEASVFANVSEMRAKAINNPDKASKERFADENALQAGMKSIFAIAENYPDLKASNNFLELQTQWSELEDRLQGARRAYNAAVKDIRNKQETFPSNIIANMMRIQSYSMFEADEAAKVDKIDAKALFSN